MKFLELLKKLGDVTAFALDKWEPEEAEPESMNALIILSTVGDYAENIADIECVLRKLEEWGVDIKEISPYVMEDFTMLAATACNLPVGSIEELKERIEEAVRHAVMEYFWAKERGAEKLIRRAEKELKIFERALKELNWEDILEKVRKEPWD